jgi:aminopeptidase N
MIKKNCAFFILIWFLSSVLLAQTDTTFVLNYETRNYDQKHIKLYIQVDFSEEKISGTCEFTFSPLIDEFKKLVLHSQLTNINSVTVNNKELSFTQDNQHLYINFDKTYSRYDEVTVIINYESYPARGMYFFKPTNENPEMPYQVWTQGQGEYNRHWYPAYDLPDDKLTSEIIVTVPGNMIAVSNGVLVSEESGSDGTKTFHWKMDQPHSNYLTSLIIGEYATVKENVRGTMLEYNLPAEWVDKMDFFYGRTPDMINFFSDYIMPYPFERYAQTTVQDFEWGGMENISATTLNRRILHDEKAVPNYRADDLIAHEFAHQWFGDYVTCKTWDHIWLNEGFATYFTDLWLENYFGKDEFIYNRMISNQTYFNEQLHDEPLDKVEPKPVYIPVELRGDKAYERGAAVLNMLRFELGDETFKNGIKHYLNKFGEQVVVTEDFRQSMEEASGKDLTVFFNQWIYGAGFPVFEVFYEWKEKEKITEIKINQVQKELPVTSLFDVPVVLEIIADKEKLTDTIRINKKENLFKYNVDYKPDLVRFNKYGWILCTVNFEKSFDELVYQLSYDDDVSGRYLAAEKLSGFGEKSVPVLERALIREPFYGVKLRIVETLKEIGGADVLRPLLFASNDFDGRVREAAIKALSIFNYQQVSDFLIDKFKNDPNHYIKAAALYSIGLSGHPDAFSILTEALKMNSHRNVIRRTIFEAFTEMKDASAIHLVAEYTKYKYSQGTMHLHDIAGLDYAKSFAEMHYEEVVEVISSALSNPYFRTRIHAANLLAELKAVDKLPLLKQIYEKERRIVVKEQMKKFIEILEEGI